MPPFNRVRAFKLDSESRLKRIQCTNCRVRYTANKAGICTVCIKRQDRREELGMK